MSEEMKNEMELENAEAVETAAEIDLTEKVLYKVKRSSECKTDFIDDLTASGVKSRAAFAQKPVPDGNFRDFYMNIRKFLEKIRSFFSGIF